MSLADASVRTYGHKDALRFEVKAPTNQLYTYKQFQYTLHKYEKKSN